MNSSPLAQPAVLSAVESLRRAQKILVFSGAGLSAASGISTYQDLGGIWSLDEAQKFGHISAETTYPKEFWSFWNTIRKSMEGRAPNSAHFALRKLQMYRPQTTLVTQNVDGLLSAAGCEDVLELHGRLARRVCRHCDGAKGLFGRCLRCFGKLHPDVVMFGQELNERPLNAALAAAKECDLLIMVGTRAQVYPAANLPTLALRRGAKFIVIDPSPPLIASAAHCVIEQGAEQALPLLMALAFNIPPSERNRPWTRK
jgi:NAD-dependent deacetylase